MLIHTISAFTAPILPELLVATASMLLLLLGTVKYHNICALINQLSLIAIASALVMNFLADKHHHTTLLISHFVRFDDYTIYAKGLLLILAGTVLLLHMANKSPALHKPEFPIMLMLSVVGMMVMVSASDFLSLYMGLELQTICLYVLAAYDRENSKSSEAGLKYFVLSALASGILLYGISLIYGFASSTNFTQIYNQVFIANSGMGSIMVLVGVIMVVSAMLFKLSAAPFHMWTLDVYHGSPYTVTAFFASLPKVAMMLLFAKLTIFPFGPWQTQIQPILMSVAGLSMLVGAIGGLKQTNIKRMLAYSTIGHMGYILAAISTYSEGGAQTVILYAAIYSITALGIFACLFQIKAKGLIIEEISSLAGIAKHHPTLSAILATFMFSMAGIPPLAGFFAKFQVFAAVIKYEHYMLATIGIIASVIAAFYYLRIVKTIYFDSPQDNTNCAGSTPLILISFIAFILNLLFIFIWEGCLALTLALSRNLYP